MLKKGSFKNVVFCAAIGVNANNPDAWIKYVDKEVRGERSRADIVMEIKTPNWSRTLELESDVEGKKEALSTIKSPAKEKGIRTLRVESRLWNYFPKLKRTVSVSSSMLLSSWMGSDFTNDDILKASSMSEDYDHAFDKVPKAENGTLRVIVNTAKSNSKVMWPKIVSYSAESDCLPRKYLYYDKEGKLRRTLTFSEIKTFEGHKVPTKWVMRPEDDKTKETTILYKDIKFNVHFDDDHFGLSKLTE
jgi:outer membrane lipoprotein-sorting protein